MGSPAPRLDVEAIRRDFPILARQVHGKPLVYLDNAASTQKPHLVLEATNTFLETEYANVHRGVHWLSEQSTWKYEHARGRVARFINAPNPTDVVFVKGTTDAVNLVASSFGAAFIREGDEILITHMEHHSNIVPWQLLCERTGAKLVVAPIDDRGELIWPEFEKRITKRTKIVSVVHVSNALGTVNPVRDIVHAAHSRGVPVFIDGAQAIMHMKVDVQDLECDFYAFSAHKLYGPTGLGALYGKKEWWEKLPPYQGGGDMILNVTFEKTTYAKAPFRFEAGTPHIAGAVGLSAAIDYVENLGWDAIEPYERDLLDYATERIGEIDRVRIIGTAREKAGVISFVMDGVHPHDIGTILDREGIAVRVGHHCAQPVMERFGVPATARASFAFYNTRAEIDRLVEGIVRIREVFG
ncbi:MAG: cysteine desulfurase [Deltaproteobacteria bacterium]|nr:cysteine desulfurase [Deltaproteobacteria bacterium]